ncbi:nuclear transport factor 2 family protein [Thalassotalea ponticola]|uniref:nuclear transport factor 2 family protein n=1 Tax=Thalassotalea ponticola TaxID=1523392 RepID=UPI0025B4B19F|nr:nuclear transport factor 2 family protein [Thalassotalea ponticola]MDN3651929.1 nuclear transport factor 2 family protein [Thalassotalea ponticola]
MDNTATQQTFVHSSLPNWLSNFIQVYESLGVDNLENLNDIYDTDVAFEDPMHKVQGFDNLQHYFDALYTNLSECRFTIDNVIANQDQAALYWHMVYTHPKLNGGKPVSVEGHSHLKAANDKVIYHRDYVDVGAMLYEHIPVVGRMIKAIKKRAGQ